MEDLTGTELTVENADDRNLEVKESFGDAVEQLHRLTVKVDTEEQRDRIVIIGKDLKTKISQVEGLRTRHYKPEYEKVEALRAVYDTPLKLAKKVIKSAQAAVTEYNERKRREAQIAREKKEAEARKARKEAERKQREAEDAERRAREEAEARKAAEEKEKQRLSQAKIDEELRKFEEEKAELAREKAELARKQKEEEETRLAHAVEAERVGNLDKVNKTLEKEKPIPIDAPPVQKGPSKEEIEAKAKAEAEEIERREKVEAENKAAKEREATEKEAAAKAKREADEATAKAKEAELAASAVVDVLPTGTTRQKYMVEGSRCYLEFLEAVVASARKAFDQEDAREKNPLEDSIEFVPRALEYAGFNIKKPNAFRSPALTKDVNDLKSVFRFPGVKTWAEVEDQFKANKIEIEAGE